MVRLALLCAVAMTTLVAISPATAASQAERDDCQAEDTDRAVAACTRIIERPDGTARIRSRAYIYRGNGRYNKGDFDRAIADYTEAIRLEPKDVHAYDN